MPWLITSPDHQKPCYWLCVINWFLSFTGKYLCYVMLRDWKSKYIPMFPKVNSVGQGLFGACTVGRSTWLLQRPCFLPCVWPAPPRGCLMCACGDVGCGVATAPPSQCSIRLLHASNTTRARRCAELKSLHCGKLTLHTYQRGGYIMWIIRHGYVCDEI